MHNREMIEACKQRDALTRQQEILFDIAYGLGVKGVHSQDDLMEWLDGSRGLFGRVQTWAGEFDAVWEGWKANGISEGDYIGEIDDFIAAKYKSLVNEFEMDQQRVISIQVVPYTERSEGNTIIAQVGGPDASTKGWAVYTRDPCGLAHWFADTDGEEQAMFIGGALADKHNVGIEPQPWKEQTNEQAS